MKKKCVALLLALALLCGLAPAALASDETPVVITDAAGLLSMAADPLGSYELGADIDLKDVDWRPFGFAGKLDGKGHSIYNLKTILAGAESFTSVDGNRKEYETLGVGLFSSLRGATVSNLNILNGRVTVLADQNCFCALLAGYIEDGIVENVSVSGTVELTSSAVMVGVGGLCGFGKGEFRFCEADVTLIHTDRLTAMRCEQFTGGVLATGYAACDHCRVKLRGYTSCHGYVHDGGLIGMHFRYFDYDAIGHSSSGNRVEGFITFFEDNWDRRAYCDAYCGENLYGTLTLENNDNAFERREVYDYSTELVPHGCAEPAYSAAVTEPDCTHFGYTTYTCNQCGYQYTDDYTAPRHAEGVWEITKDATTEESGEKVCKCSVCGTVLETAEIAPHVAGEWEIITEPGFQSPGLQVRRCTDCGAVLEEQELAPLIRTERMELSEREIKLYYKGAANISAAVFPQNADDTGYSWSSSDNSVVTVNSEGKLFARSVGDATVYCTANDGGCGAECTVHVRYSLGQQLIRIFLLGFLWYK